MGTHLVVNSAGMVVNVVEYDGTATYNPGAGLTLVDPGSATPMPCIGWTSVSGVLTPPAAAALTLAQQAATALASGIQIVSTSTPALNGTYGCGDGSRADIMAEMLSIAVVGSFTNGTATMQFADAAGAFHTFTLAEFRAFAIAVGAYVGTLKNIVISNSGTLPSQPLTIA